MDEKKYDVKFLVEDIVGCKWSMSILDMIDKGINRPGAMVREQDGLTTKVLNERLRKLQKYQVIDKVEHPEVPPRVEYVYTEFGKKFLDIVKAIRNLEDEMDIKK
ncbi:HxlR family transcriptional regulator [Bdellovibrio bacteriovorus]|uniref:HxlR family transcriptional regulator n=1 Tax=Bdellovibrio bacteriovorus TaxID=959 RepID=A0A150WQ22_BDEBC|nr:helix-turn-helix domain-containing protein [Bdellovibrio bacteriovorus]KYG66488.1 HxlR family transcriptional regulator [Bdellovibrio bacteriovorus]